LLLDSFECLVKFFIIKFVNAVLEGENGVEQGLLVLFQLDTVFLKVVEEKSLA
jgi:hypothetical protein